MKFLIGTNSNGAVSYVSPLNGDTFEDLADDVSNPMIRKSVVKALSSMGDAHIKLAAEVEGVKHTVYSNG